MAGNDHVHPIFRSLVDRCMAPKDTGTNDTMPKHHWMHNVITGAGVTVEWAEKHHERLTRWFNEGEQVWIATDSLRTMAKYEAIDERAEKESNFLRRELTRGNRRNRGEK